VLIARYVTRFGWRAYALPVLVVVTIVAFTTLFHGSRPSAHGAPKTSTRATVAASATTTTTKRAEAPAGPTSSQVTVDTGGQSEDVAADALPPGPAYTKRGDGTFRTLAGETKLVGTSTRVRRYVIEVENGVTGVDLGAYAKLVDQTLDAPRSWTGGNHTAALQRVSSAGQADFRIALTSSLTLRPPCGHSLNIETSCWDKQHGPSRVYLNVARWVRGDAQFGQDLAAYHLYMINHEVGHALGHFHTYVCLPGGLAPVMMQQTITLKENEGKGPKICQPNAWPYPNGVSPKVAVPT
jgi:hypothetical protein